MWHALSVAGPPLVLLHDTELWLLRSAPPWSSTGTRSHHSHRVSFWDVVAPECPATVVLRDAAFATSVPCHGPPQGQPAMSLWAAHSSPRGSPAPRAGGFTCQVPPLEENTLQSRGTFSALLSPHPHCLSVTPTRPPLPLGSVHSHSAWLNRVRKALESRRRNLRAEF